MKQICRATGIEFEITPEDLAFYQKVSLKIGGKIFEIPPPTLCPEERQRRRLAWRNERKLYWRNCTATGKKVLSMFSELSHERVVDTKFWFSDEAEDARAHGLDFDFSKTFAEQFESLISRVQLPAQAAFDNENADFANYIGHNKNVYWIFDCDFNEDCFYGHLLIKNKDCVDNTKLFDSELCYECLSSTNCYNSIFLQDCHNCSDSLFLQSCIGCTSCFGSSDLRNKKFYFMNQPCTKDEYDNRIAALNIHLYPEMQRIKADTETFFENFPRKDLVGVQNEGSSGNYLVGTHNCSICFDLDQCEDCRYCTGSNHLKLSMDIDGFGGLDGAGFCYEANAIGHGANSVLFGVEIVHGVKNINYSYFIYNNCSNLFGCIGLRHAQYCILNKQYSKEEYEVLVPKIIEHMRSTGEWGEFFPIELSPFAYNETVAQEYFPLTKADVLAKGWKWRDEKTEVTNVTRTIPANRLPDSIDDIPDDILSWAIECEATKKPFKIQKAELDFYRKMRLPIPHYHPDVRHAHRMAKRNPRKLWNRTCDNCQTPIQTTYAPERPEKVFCESCYQQAVY